MTSHENSKKIKIKYIANGKTFELKHMHNTNTHGGSSKAKKKTELIATDRVDFMSKQRYIQ